MHVTHVSWGLHFRAEVPTVVVIADFIEHVLCDRHHAKRFTALSHLILTITPCNRSLLIPLHR